MVYFTHYIFKENKMKKAIAIFMFILCIFGMVACGGNEGTGEETFEITDNGLFAYRHTNGVVIHPHDSMRQISEAMGEEKECRESSGASGRTLTYIYDGLRIVTYPDKNANYIYQIILTDTTVSTLKGIKIGDPIEKVVEVYGDDFTYSGSGYKYTKGLSNLLFVYTNGLVSSIQYTAIINDSLFE
jgi:hypothetical protein